MDNPRNKPEEQVRRTAERLAEQPKEAFERVTAVGGDAAEAMRNSCAKAVKGLQDYQNCVMEFTQTNVNRSFELAQRLLSVKSPTEFLEISADHLRRQGEIIADQAKQLTELTQNVTLASTEPLRTGFERVFKHAA